MKEEKKDGRGGEEREEKRKRSIRSDHIPSLRLGDDRAGRRKGKPQESRLTLREGRMQGGRAEGTVTKGV